MFLETSIFKAQIKVSLPLGSFPKSPKRHRESLGELINGLAKCTSDILAAFVLSSNPDPRGEHISAAVLRIDII